MTSPLADLEPQAVWKHFTALTTIPRRSGREAAARDYVISIAKQRGLDAVHDGAGNTVIHKPAYAGREAAPMVLLQGHLDMVCEKNEGTAHNFDTDPIRVVRNDDWLKADGTTLGADNGVGVAAGLAVMESTDIAHGPLEFVFTIDEETGLTGAAEFKGGVLQSKFFLNLDNEETGTLCIGCAGGVKTIGRRKLEFKSSLGGSAWRIKVSGLKGGHSGVDIHQGRGNALRILGDVLQRLTSNLRAGVASVNGGSAQNAIPREAAAVVVLDPRREKALRSLVSECEANWKTDLGSFDPELQIGVDKADHPGRILRASDARRLTDLLVTLNGDLAEITTSQRSAIEASRNAVARMVATAFGLAGFEAEHSGNYPGWKPEPDSEIVKKLQAAHEQVFGKPAKLIAMHAGLECGVIGEKYPGMQMISFGPTIVDPHSPNERVQISTVETFWKLLRAALEMI